MGVGVNVIRGETSMLLVNLDYIRDGGGDGICRTNRLSSGRLAQSDGKDQIGRC